MRYGAEVYDETESVHDNILVLRYSLDDVVLDWHPCNSYSVCNCGILSA